METVTTQTAAPVTTAPAEAKPAVDDIVSRASAFKAQPEAKPQEGSPVEAKNVQEYLAKVNDPVARKLVEDAYKSMQADYTKKTQEVASQRKEMESLKTRLEQSGQFTPSKIQELLQNPSFVQAAREYEASTKVNQAQVGSQDLSEEELSYLSPEQQKLYLNQKKMHADTQSMLSNLNNELSTMKIQKEDQELANRYKNYDPNMVNQTYQDMMTGKINATREHLWKALDYEEGMKRAYQLGQADAKAGISERQNASTTVRGVTTQTIGSDVPAKDSKESFQSYWKRLADSAKVRLGK
jgi:hypothetical protein